MSDARPVPPTHHDGRNTAPRGTRAALIDAPERGLEGRLLNDDPQLMDESYRLRYQVYCLERCFLDAEAYPDERERDQFDRFSLHVGVVDDGTLLATARLVRINIAGLPLFHHCLIDPHETELYDERNRTVEVSRLCVSRELSRHRPGGRTAVVTALYKALYQTSKRGGYTHWLVATEPSLQRLVTGFGFPFRAIGPSIDYHGPVAPYLMDLCEFDQVILSGTRPALGSFLDGLEPELRPLPRVASVACCDQTTHAPATVERLLAVL